MVADGSQNQARTECRHYNEINRRCQIRRRTAEAGEAVQFGTNECEREQCAKHPPLVACTH
jgi:hypothetical protein